MTKKEIIAYLRLCADDDVICLACPRFEKYEYGGTAECNEKLMLEAADALEESLRQQEERRWIPVKERLPDPGERVLATDGGFVGELYVNSRGQWQRYNVNDYSLMMALDILWWIPLPEPPKGVADL